MSYLKHKFIAVVVMILMIIVVGLVAAPAEKETMKVEQLINKLNLNEKTEIIIKKTKDVTGDSIEDRIFLMGRRVKNSLFFDQLTVVIKDKNKQEYSKATYEKFSGYEPQLLVKDFSGDKVGDIMVKAPTGGSGGIVNYFIATFKGNEPQVIFDNQNNKGVEVTGRFLPGFKAKLIFKELNKKVMLDLDFNKDKYIKERIYNQNGQLVKRMLIRPYSYPFGKLEVIDYNRDGTYELKGHQKVVGAYGADMISKIESIWGYRDQDWKLKEVQYSTYLLKYNDFSSASN